MMEQFVAISLDPKDGKPLASANRRTMEENYDRVEEIVKLHQERDLHSLSLAKFKAIWDEFNNAPVPALRDGAL